LKEKMQKKLFRNDKNPVASRELIGLFKRGKKIYAKQVLNLPSINPDS